MLWHNFYDSVKEADGNRLIRNWKFNLLIFKAARRKNYSKETLNLLLQVNYLLSPRESAQLKWCRCINTCGRQGTNISMDLYLEHLNRRLKTTLRNVGSNITDNSVNLAAESIAIVQHVCATYYLNLIWTNSHIVHCFLLWTNRHMALSTSVTDYRILQVYGYGFSLRGCLNTWSLGRSTGDECTYHRRNESTTYVSVIA